MIIIEMLMGYDLLMREYTIVNTVECSFSATLMDVLNNPMLSDDTIPLIRGPPVHKIESTVIFAHL